ncbi:acyltransferase [Arthrobacter sp. ISL-85]|uniref:acyltransferase family protein n=1 Tax=Arthrobacter sp. ISL-85 TaxID=2819115 RepID=UPI001BE8E3BC|nr:acyltransferase [Arthrobacter sp. ISL-85]MBT2568964.1 acyltransferase [Arthrobacter sp. ISL-85]
MKQKTRETWPDVAKGVSILSVVLFHTGALSSPATQAGEVWTLVDIGLFTFIMPLFFLVSGLFMGKSLALPLGAFVATRVWPIAYLFLLWSLIFAAVQVATGGVLGATLWASFSLQTILWYLAALSVYMVLTKILMPVNTLVVLLGAAIVAFPFAVWFPFEGWGLSHTPHFFVFFLLGCHARDQIFRFVDKVRLSHVAALIGAGATLCLLGKILPGASNFAYALTPLIALPLLLIASKWAGNSATLARPLSYLGRNTLPVFLIHPIALSGISWTMKGLSGPADSLVWLLPVIVCGATVLVCLLTWLALRGIPWLFKAPVIRVRDSAPKTTEQSSEQN